ncbi:cardiolipin synthase [Albidovulum sp.]
MQPSFVTLLALLALPILGWCIWRAVVTARTPQGAVAWVVFLVSAPWFAVPAFLVFGKRRLAGYTARWRQSHAEMRDYAAFERMQPAAAPREPVLEALQRIGGMPFIGGNDLRILINGEATFEAISAAIDAARRTVCFQAYIVRDDGLGARIAERLIAAARRGVAVRVIYDGVGSQRLSAAWPARLREAGVEVLDPVASTGPTSRLDINFRNHRKTVIVDGRVAFVGGHNVGDEYLGRDPALGPWRDTHLQVAGPVVAQLQLVFAEDWHWLSGERLEAELDWAAARPQPADMLAAAVPTGPADPIDSGALMFFTAIGAARRRVWIASPYFVPDTDILAALVAAALAGKDVRILLPEAIDHYLPWLAARAYFDEVRAAGVRIFLYQEGFMHQKVVLIDDALAAIGTANLDNRSFRLNFETMVFAADPRLAGDVGRMLEADLALCREIASPLAAQPLWLRIGAPLARLLAPVL